MGGRMGKRMLHLAGAFLLAATGACEREPSVRTYQAPKDQPRTESDQAGNLRPGQVAGSAQHPAASGDPAVAAAPGAPGVPGVRWQVPPGWEAQGRSGMRYETFLIGPADQQLELTVIPLGPEAGDLRSNVDRWRGQLGLGPSTQETMPNDIQQVAIEGDPLPMLLIDLTGAAAGAADESGETTGGDRQRMLVAIRGGRERLWFFKVVGPSEIIDAERAKFVAFAESVRFDAPPGDAAPAPRPAEPRTSEAAPPTIRYEAPAGWKLDPQRRSMRLATFAVGAAEDAAEVVVSRFPGNVGGLLANLNRWRGQVGLGPIESEDEQASETIEAGPLTARVFDFRGPAGDGGGEGKRIVVALIDHVGWQWFLKLGGPDGAVDAAKGDFTTFVGSVRFEE